MSEYVKKIVLQMAEFMMGLSSVKKVGLVLTAIAIVTGIGGLFFWAGDKIYQPLMTNLNPEDSSGIIRVLREKGVPFKVDPLGKTISVPPENMHQLRLEMATLGLPQSGVVGYEIFDKQGLGTTSFVQKVNEKRAREGELMRTISTIKGIRRTRVHLALPQKSAFVEDQKKPSASVVLDLEPGTVLSDKQIYGIGNLVARAIEGMDIADVVVVDSQGKVLSKNPSDPIAAATANQLDFRHKIEGDLERRVEEMLGRVVGDGRVVARVSADVDFSQVQETQTVYDADGSAVRSVQRDVKSMEGSRPGPYGQAGAASNLPGQPPAANAPQVKSDSKTQAEVMNYEVPQTVRRTTRPSGTVRKLSVAVLVDGKPTKTTLKDGVVQEKVEAWSAEKLKEFEAVISSAVGIDLKRGDVLEVRNMEFRREDFADAERLIAENERRTYIQNMILYALIGLVVVLFFMLVVRPFVKWLTENTIDSVDSFLPQTIEELEKLQKSAMIQNIEETMPTLPERIDPEKVEGEMIKEKIITLVDANPHKAALILRDWVHGELAAAKKKAGEEKEEKGGGGGKSKTA